MNIENNQEGFSDSTFYINQSSRPVNTYSGARASARFVQDKQQNIDTDLQDYLTLLNNIAAKWNEIADKRKLTAAEERSYSNILAISNDISKYSKEKEKDIEKYIELTKDYSKIAVDAEKRILESRKKAGELTEESYRNSLDYVSEINDKVKSSVADAENLGKHFENANRTMEYLSKSFSKVKDGIRDIAVVSGLDAIKNQLMGGSTGSMTQLRNAITNQFGFTSDRDWYQFRNNLLSGTMQLNTSVGQVAFGLDDVKKYMSDLSALGIYDTEMAERQLTAVLEGTKYLGLSTETQNQILKISRRSGNDFLLQEVNDTISTLLNAQIGLSKEQLAQMTANATNSADLLSFYGNDEAMTQLINAQGFLETNYGSGVADAATAIFEDLVANGVNSDYFGLYGGQQVLDIATRDAGTALNMLVENIRKSGYVQAYANSPYIGQGAGIDANVRTIFNAANGGQSYQDFLSKTADTAGATNELISKQAIPLSEQIANFASLLVSFFMPNGSFFNVENLFYTASLVQFAFEAIQWKKANATLGVIAANTGGIGNAAGGGGKGITGLLKSIFPVVKSIAGYATLLLTAFYGFSSLFKDVSEGWKNPEDYGNKDTTGGKLKSALDSAIFGEAEGSGSNALKNALKWGAIGATVGTVIPGVGNLAGFIIGGAAGLLFGSITGAIGGNNAVTRATSNLLGVSNNSEGAPAGSGGQGESGRYPWTRTSPYGYRTHPVNGKPRSFHSGVDLAHAGGTPIGANYGGVVSKKGVDSYGANYVIITDTNNFQHKYWHLQQPSHLVEGQMVNAGQLVGLMGSTGLSTGNHLHYEVRKPDGNSTDPEPFITSNLFNASEFGVVATAKDENAINDDEMITRKVISANTLQSDAVLNKYSNSFGAGDTGKIVNSVDTGFSNLIAKLDELSARQDQSEEILKSMIKPVSSAVYKY